MTTSQPANEEQIALWNGPAGQAWVETQDSLDRLLEPFERALVEIAARLEAQRVLDVGCGTGSTTLAVARHLGPRSACLGVDLSEPMIALARERGARERSPARFICADAERHPFDAASFDLVISRFGVMFFANPIRAFANLRAAAAPDATLRTIAWRGPDENPFMTTAERAAAAYLPALPPRRPDEPGQFAFADAARVRSTLEQAGWSETSVEPLDVACVLPVRELSPYITKLGPVGRALGSVDERTRTLLLEKVHAAFEPFVHGTEVHFTAACWMIGARA